MASGFLFPLVADANPKKATDSTNIKDDITIAGGIWVDTPAFRAGSLVWERVVEDIPAYCRE